MLALARRIIMVVHAFAQVRASQLSRLNPRNLPTGTQFLIVLASRKKEYAIGYGLATSATSAGWFKKRWAWLGKLAVRMTRWSQREVPQCPCWAVVRSNAGGAGEVVMVVLLAPQAG